MLCWSHHPSLSWYRADNRNRCNKTSRALVADRIQLGIIHQQLKAIHSKPLTSQCHILHSELPTTDSTNLLKIYHQQPFLSSQQISWSRTSPKNCCIELRIKRQGIQYLHCFIHKTRIYHKTFKYRTEIHKTRVFWLVDLSQFLTMKVSSLKSPR